MSDSTTSNKAVFDLEGANCASCSITIEHFARRLKGVTDVYVDRADSTIRLDYDGNADTVKKIIGLVDRIGYKATLRDPSRE